MKKSYNPFKMWGSYVGAGIMLSLWMLSSTIQILTNNFFYSTFEFTNNFLLNLLHFIAIPVNLIVTPLYQSSSLFYPPIAFLLYVIYGFLIGYGIHSLVRSLK